MLSRAEADELRSPPFARSAGGCHEDGGGEHGDGLTKASAENTNANPLASATSAWNSRRQHEQQLRAQTRQQAHRERRGAHDGDSSATIFTTSAVLMPSVSTTRTALAPTDEEVFVHHENTSTKAMNTDTPFMPR